MRLNLGDDPAVISIAAECELDQDSVVGKLHRLWSWVSEHSTDGSLTGVPQTFVDHHVRTPGFAAAMIKAGWLEASNSGLVIPKFEVHMSESAKKRAINALQQREKRVREMSEKTTDKSSTRSSSSSYIKKGGAGGKQSRKPKAPNYNAEFIGTEPQPGDGALPPALVALFQSQGKEEAYKNVWMTEAQFDALTKRFGEDRVNWAGQQLVDWSLSLEVSNKTNLAGWQSYRAKRDHAGCIRNQILRRWPELGGEDGKGL